MRGCLGGDQIGECRPLPSIEPSQAWHADCESSYLIVPQAFEHASGKKVNYKLCDRRAGDTVAVWAATETAERELGWKTKLTVQDMGRDQWAWASKHPKGFES